MPDQTQKPPAPATPAKVNPVLPVTLIVSAIMFVVIGTILPGLSGMTGPEGTVIQLVFYAVAAGDVAIALWLRSRMKKAQPSSSGPVQHQSRR